MTFENNEEPKSKKKVKGKLIGFSLIIVGIILVINGIIQHVRANSMFGDLDAPWIETVGLANGLLMGGILMIFPGIFISVATRQYQYISKTISTGGVKTLGHVEEFERYEKMIREGSSPRTSGTNKPQNMTSLETSSDTQVVKVRCQLCGALNDEDAKFCDQCAQPL
jgi:hypothetical protein